MLLLCAGGPSTTWERFYRCGDVRLLHDLLLILFWFKLLFSALSLCGGGSGCAFWFVSVQVFAEARVEALAQLCKSGGVKWQLTVMLSAWGGAVAHSEGARLPLFRVGLMCAGFRPASAGAAACGGFRSEGSEVQYAALPAHPPSSRTMECRVQRRESLSLWLQGVDRHRFAVLLWILWSQCWQNPFASL